MFGNIVQIIQGIASGVLGPDRWFCSDNGVRGGKVTAIDTGTSGTGMAVRAWVEFTYEDEAGITHVVRGEGDLMKFGARGGKDVIEFDGEPVEKDDVVISQRFVWANPPYRVVIEMKYSDEGIDHRVRFDGSPDFSVLPLDGE